jgi:hypothetical protein
MNRQQFFAWLNNPDSLDQESLADLYQLVQEYPYFQSAKLLYLINLRITQDYRYENELKNMAVHLPDRSKLKDWLTMLEKKEWSRTSGQASQEMKSPAAKPKIKDPYLENIEEKIRESVQEIEKKKSLLKELLEEKKAIVGDFDEDMEEMTGPGAKPSRIPLPKDDLLEEFIRQHKTGPGSSSGFYNSDDTARKSIEENDQIISETLARLIAAQGKKEKAIEIYQKLMLKNPQKSSYFAAQIEKLRKEP